MSVFGSGLANGQLSVAGYTRIGREMSLNSAVAIGGPLSAAAPSSLSSSLPVRGELLGGTFGLSVGGNAIGGGFGLHL